MDNLSCFLLGVSLSTVVYQLLDNYTHREWCKMFDKLLAVAEQFKRERDYLRSEFVVQESEAERD